MKRMSGGAKRECDRALHAPERANAAAVGAAERQPGRGRQPRPARELIRGGAACGEAAAQRACITIM